MVLVDPDDIENVSLLCVDDVVDAVTESGAAAFTLLSLSIPQCC